MVTLRTLVFLPRLTIVWWICSASSRVGATIKRADLVELALGQALQDGQHEGCGLAGAGLGQAQHVAAFEDDGDGLFLDGGGRGVAGGLDARGNARVERKLFKIHYRVLLDSWSQVALSAQNYAADDSAFRACDRVDGTVKK